MANTDIGRMHAEALQRMLSDLPYPIYVGEVTDGQPDYPYLVLWPPPANRQTLLMNGYSGEATTVTQITAAGRDVWEVITALDRVSAKLHRRRPEIPGRRCGLVGQVDDAAPPPQPQRDEQVSTPERPVFFSFLHFRLHSTAASQEP